MPLEVITQVMHLDLLLGKLIGIGGQVRLQIVLVHTKLRLQIGDGHTPEARLGRIVRRKVRPVALRLSVSPIGLPLLGLVFAVKHQRNVE